MLELYLRKDVDYIVEPWLTFKTKPLTFEFKIHQLANLDTVIHAGDGNIVAFRAHHVSGDGCPKGYLAGIWKHKSHEGGGFRGKWIAIDGLVMGHLAGEFKRTDDHGGVFAGKWWDTDGNWQGHVRGKWGYGDSPTDCADCPVRIGRFVGHFTDTEGNIRGEIAGRIGHPDDPEAVDHENHFWGKWWVHCPGTGGQ
ncbi:MAG: hypothetical protein IIB00_09140 [candidate division Zixibacteria bacterium]|nr:hypothetical protein [candidate division Zixibacteria bacterium]